MDNQQESYDEYRSSVKSEQQGKDYHEVKEEMQSKNEFILEMDRLPKQNHLWVDRGAVLSCEGAGHANHHAYKRMR